MTGQMDGKDDHQGYYISRHQREGRERERESESATQKQYHCGLGTHENLSTSSGSCHGYNKFPFTTILSGHDATCHSQIPSQPTKTICVFNALKIWVKGGGLSECPKLCVRDLGTNSKLDN